MAVKHPRRRALAFAGAGVAMLAVGVIAARVSLAVAHAKSPASAHAGTGPRAHGPAASSAPGVIVVDRSVGDTFTQAPASAAPALTAAQAWARYAQMDGGRSTIPAGISSQLGLVSVPVGPANPDDPDQASLIISNGVAYRVLNELAYGYSSPAGSCPWSRNPNNPGPIGKSCVRWTFLDADTGQLIEETSQINT